jgi:hypothetical protein
METHILSGYADRVDRPYVDFLRRFGTNFGAREARGTIVKDLGGRRAAACSVLRVEIGV